MEGEAHEREREERERSEISRVEEWPRLDERKEGFRVGDKTERYIESESNRRSRGIGGVVDDIGEVWRVVATLTLWKSSRYIQRREWGAA